MKGKSNVLDPSKFDEIYLKAIKAGANYADSPDKRKYYANGFNQAIKLYHRYLVEDQIEIEEAERRVRLIIETLLDENAGKNFGHKTKGS